MRPYQSYEEKINTYFHEVADHAEAKQPGILEILAVSGSPEVLHASSRFVYMDTNPYRHGTKAIEDRLAEEVVAIVGVGGTGSYLVDILAKTNVKELHLYDDDTIDGHSAFRIPGAVRVGELAVHKPKVEWHRERYSEVRKDGLHVHKTRITRNNIACLEPCTTVFIAVDDLETRRTLQRACNEMGKLHIAVGIGLEIEGEQNDEIGGMIKIETNYVPYDQPPPQIQREPNAVEAPGVYESNIQTAETNMLGAALSIVEWKAARGFYRSEREAGDDSSLYSTTTGTILSAKKGR